MSAIEIYQSQVQGQMALGLKFNRPDVSLAELLQVWQPLCDDHSIYKMYGANNHAQCRGCSSNCCTTAYVIPDLISFKKISQHLALDYLGFIQKFFQPEKLEVGLLRIKPEPCVFLQDNICTVYPLRSLICRFYICTPLLGDTEQLIYSLAWAAIAATQVFAEEAGLLTPAPFRGLTSFDLMFHRLIEDYRSKPELKLFLKAENYDDIPLQPFLYLNDHT